MCHLPRGGHRHRTAQCGSDTGGSRPCRLPALRLSSPWLASPRLPPGLFYGELRMAFPLEIDGGKKNKEEFKFQCLEAVFLTHITGGFFPEQQPDVRFWQRPRDRQSLHHCQALGRKFAAGSQPSRCVSEQFITTLRLC